MIFSLVELRLTLLLLLHDASPFPLPLLLLLFLLFSPSESHPRQSDHRLRSGNLCCQSCWDSSSFERSRCGDGGGHVSTHDNVVDLAASGLVERNDDGSIDAGGSDLLGLQTSSHPFQQLSCDLLERETVS